MQLRNARLCLDCDEIHQESRCPICASESFAFIKRWVPASERRARPRTPETNGADVAAEILLKALDKPPKKPRGRPKAKF